MFRTFAVLLLLLGLATATPVVCLCAPAEAAGLIASAPSDSSQPGGSSSVADAPSLVATSAAAVVASLVAAVGGIPISTPWQLPRPEGLRWLSPAVSVLSGPSWSPLVPPPR
jgi:hypothetical protein